MIPIVFASEDNKILFSEEVYAVPRVGEVVRHKKRSDNSPDKYAVYIVVNVYHIFEDWYSDLWRGAHSSSTISVILREVV
jgi:hypothetical protein